MNLETCSEFNVELINIGSELLLGFVTNTNQQWLCRQLSELGYVVTRQVATPDDAVSITTAVREALSRAQLVICTGGLGPTSDDITRQCIADMLGKPLQEHPDILANIEQFFLSRCRPMPARTRVQALAPEGAVILRNTNGTAPGLALDAPDGSEDFSRSGRLLIMLPGPPRELQPMFLGEVVPLLQSRFPHPRPFACRTLRSTGVGESLVEEKIAEPLADLIRAGLGIGYCARFGEVDIRLIARGTSSEVLVNDAERVIRQLLPNEIFGSDRDELHEVVVRALASRGQTVAVAESCTGGCIANRLTNVPGASEVFVGGFVTYSNEAKQICLGVKAETLNEHGAVSADVAREMAEGAMTRLKSTYALAATGIAGPSGGTPSKPVGTVYIALAGGGRTIALRHSNRYDRESFKFVTSQQALELLRRRLAS